MLVITFIDYCPHSARDLKVMDLELKAILASLSFVQESFLILTWKQLAQSAGQTWINCETWTIGIDKGGYPVNIFLISLLKHMLWVLIRSASPRRF